MTGSPRQPPHTSTPAVLLSEHTCAVVNLILESFRSDDLATLCQDGGITLEELASLRTAFIESGTARLQELLHPCRWLQVNLALDTMSAQWIAFMTGDFQDYVRSWVEQGQVEQIFFMHKPPGIRLRFLGVHDQFLPELSKQLDRLVRQGTITNGSRTVYDAEIYQFGGETGLQIAHTFFTLESLAVLAYHRLHLQQRTIFPPIEFSLVLLDSFLRKVTEDEWELWDVWCKMALTGRLPGPVYDETAVDSTQLATVREAFLPLLRDSTVTLACVSAAERTILAHYREKLPPIVTRLLEARDSGALLWGLREILPFWIIFHWNRMGFDLDRQRLLTLVMTRILDPKA